ncbi:membrane protein [Cupriavidus sp. HPC(L)]|nr:membrane protein [Cupriavidus sp. HPC(L)]
MIAIVPGPRRAASASTQVTAIPRPARMPAGSSLVDAMVGLLLGTLATGAAAMVFLTMRSAYAIAAEQRELEQRGAALLDAIAALLRHAGWHPDPTTALPAPLSGRDDCGQPRLGGTLACDKPGVAGSDALLIRFGGDHPAGDPALPDRYLTDCSGYPVPIAAVPAETRPALSARTADYLTANLLYVADGADGEPQLLCRYPGRGDGGSGGGSAGRTWSTGALARGVETLQLRYGIDRDGDGRVDAFLRASELGAAGPGAWCSVLAVQIALVLRTGVGTTAALPPPLPLPLLPARMAGEQGDDIVFRPRSRPNASRRVFATTVWLRNAPFRAGSPC